MMSHLPFLDVFKLKLYNRSVIKQHDGLFMKNFIRVSVIVMFCLCLSISYAQSYLDSEIMDDEEEMEYENNSVQTSAPETETRERSEYNVDMRPYVDFKYVSQKTKIERK